MYTVIETLEFQSAARKVWSEDERFAFIDYLAQNPLAGDVIPQAEGRTQGALGSKRQR